MLHYLKQEAEKAERKATPVLIENVSRRKFLGGAVAASGFVLAVRIPDAAAREPLKPYPTGGEKMPHGYGNASDPHVFVSIKPDGAVTILAHRSEMGTGVRTSLPMVVADEMEADWSRVSIQQAVGDEPLYGNQDTDGSRSMRHYIQPMRECGAAMRQMLETAAAAKWGVDVALCRAKAHHVVLLDAGMDVCDLRDVAWRALGNTDWRRDVVFSAPLDHFAPDELPRGLIGIDARAKGWEDGHPRGWPEEIEMSDDIVMRVNEKWASYGIGG